MNITRLLQQAGISESFRLQRSAPRPLQFIESYAFPSWLRARFAREHPQLNSQQQELVWQGLREYFWMCRVAGKRMVAMPSQVVDDAWHAFILSTLDYQNFCRDAFGRFLHHTPAEAMSTPTSAQDGIKRAWRLACRREGIDPLKPDRLPLIFALDAQLQIPNGFIYHLNCMATLAGANAASRTDYCAMHIGCGGGCSGASGGDCSDGGTGCASSCGSSCGGGCGGGCGGS